MTSYRSPLDPYGALWAADRDEADGRDELPVVPGDPSGREAMRRGLALVRAYARGDAAAVAAALDGAEHAVARQLPSVTGDILRLVVGIVMSGPRTLTPADVVRAADTIAAAGPPHHELAVTQAVRAWADGVLIHLRSSWRVGAGAAA
ncbi:hypothetical protein ACFVZ2_33810, partial [Streptomyces lasiicapitis]